MRAILLAAGRGERLRPLTDSTPKALTQIGGESLLARHLRRFAECGICDIAINIAHLGGQIHAAIGDGGDFGVRVRYSPESPALETAGGIRLAMARGLLPPDEPFLAVNADIICDINYANFTIGDKMNCHLLLTKNPATNPRGDFSLSQNGLLLPPNANALTYTGTGIYRPQMFAALVAGECAKLLPLLQTEIKNQTASGATHNGIWHDIGTPAALTAARTEFAATPFPQRRKSP